MFRIFFVLFAMTLCLIGADTQAQVNWDIPETETPGGGDNGGGMSPGEEFYCLSCCDGSTRDSSCCRDCNCQCGPEIPNCVAHSTMSAAKVPTAVHAFVLNSFAETRDQLSTTARGKSLYSVLEKNAVRVSEIFAKNPRLSARTGAAFAKYWPHNFWTNTGKDAHKVSPEALKELRQILRQIAKADADMGASGVSASIRSDVLPHLGEDLIGVAYHDAFDCFIKGQSCERLK